MVYLLAVLFAWLLHAAAALVYRERHEGVVIPWLQWVNKRPSWEVWLTRAYREDGDLGVVMDNLRVVEPDWYRDVWWFAPRGWRYVVSVVVSRWREWFWRLLSGTARPMRRLYVTVRRWWVTFWYVVMPRWERRLLRVIAKVKGVSQCQR